MMKSILIAAAGMALTVGAVELDGGWTLAMDPANAGKTNGWAAAVRPDAKPAPVPGVIQQVYPHSCGVAWYWRRVVRPAARADERVILRFGAVDYFCDVYLDGKKIGSNEGAENTFARARPCRTATSSRRWNSSPAGATTRAASRCPSRWRPCRPCA